MSILMQPDVLTKRDIIYRAGLFTILELIFIVLAVRVSISPVVLSSPRSITFAEAKAGFTVLIIIWHALAVMMIKDIIFFFFSSEWFSLYHQTGRLDSKSTDRVSKVTAGLMAQASHFVSGKATTLYRTSLLMMLFLAAVGGLGPSALFVNTMLVDTPTHIPLANISFPDPHARVFDTFTPPFRNYLLPYERANNIFRMETFENVDVGYDILDNVMIPWPHIEPGFSAGKLVYKSDVMTFNHTCSWHLPVGPPRYVFLDEGAFPGIAGIVLSWTLDDGREYLTATFNNAGNLTSAFSPDELDPLIGILFFANNTDPGIGLNLSGLPTFTFFSDPQNVTQTTTIFLLCSPNLTTHTAEVTLFNNTLNAHILPSNTKPVNNINPDPFAQVQFLRDLYDRLLFLFGDSQSLIFTLVNSIAHFLFFCTHNDSCEGHLQPLPLPTINDNMNQLVRVAAQGVLDGFNGTKPGTSTILVRGFDTFITTAIRQEEKMVLVVSGTILIALIVVVVMIEVLLTGFVIFTDPTSLKTFNLENVAQVAYPKN